MNPFLEIPVCMAGKADNPDAAEKIEVGRILPSEIAMYYPGYYWGTIVVMKSGSSFLSPMSCAELDNARYQYYDFIKKNPNVRQNITVIKQNTSDNLKPVN